MVNKIKSRIEIRNAVMNVKHYVELQDRTDGFLLAGRGIDIDWSDEERRALLKEISLKHNLDTDTDTSFRKTFKSLNPPTSEVYDAIRNMTTAMVEFEKEKDASKIVHVRVPAYLKAKLADVNTSELVRGLLEKHFKES